VTHFSMKFLLSVLAIVVAAFCVSVEGAMSQAEAQAKAEVRQQKQLSSFSPFSPSSALSFIYHTANALT